MSRNNEERLGSLPDEGTPAIVQPMKDPMSFVIPTIHVNLPSKGKFYPKEHPLYNQDSIEIRLMTAKDEDILASPNLIKKGIVLDRLLSNLILDKRIKLEDLLIGDKNAILIQTRISAYGPDYNVRITCPQCSHEQEQNYDLEECYKTQEGSLEDEVTSLENGNFKVVLPNTKVECEIRIMTGKQERAIFKSLRDNNKKKEANILTQQLKMMLISANGYDQPNVVEYFAENMPVGDSRKLREIHDKLSPNANLSADFECEKCDYLEDLEVPLTSEFFGLTDEYIQAVYEELFLLKHYGGWSFFEAYNLPITLRRWFLQRISREMEKRNEEYKKASSN